MILLRTHDDCNVFPTTIPIVLLHLLLLHRQCDESSRWWFYTHVPGINIRRRNSTNRSLGSTAALSPLIVARAVKDVARHPLNFILLEAIRPSWHRVLSILNLVDDLGFVESAKPLGDISLGESASGDDAVATTKMTGGTVVVEDLRAKREVTSRHGRGWGEHLAEDGSRGEQCRNAHRILNAILHASGTRGGGDANMARQRRGRPGRDRVGRSFQAADFHDAFLMLYNTGGARAEARANRL